MEPNLCTGTVLMDSRGEVEMQLFFFPQPDGTVRVEHCGDQVVCVSPDDVIAMAIELLRDRA